MSRPAPPGSKPGPRRCLVCAHPQRAAIEDLITSGLGDRAIAKRFEGFSHDVVRRHKLEHLAPAMKKAMAEIGKPTIEGGRDAISRIEDLYRKAERLLEAAEADGQRVIQLGALKELRQAVELLARLTGQLDTRPQVNVLNLSASPEWQMVQARIVQALMPYPEARIAVSQILEAEVVE